MTPLLSSALLRAQTDDRLVELAAAGHDRAFEAIVERYRRPLLRYLRRLLSDTLAEDVVQATFINAWSSLRTGTEVRDLRPWLYRIAHNAAINSLKKVGEAMEEVPESVGGFASEPAAELERRDEMHRALTSIAALPSRQRAALLAVAVDGRAHADVATELGLTDGAVRQLVHRARTTLRGGLTALTPLPLLHMLMTSAGDSTVARVAEVAAGAGGAGAASVSLKAGAAAVLATGAIVTGGPELAKVVHPSQAPSAPAAASAAPKASSAAAVTPAALTSTGRTPPATTTGSSTTAAANSGRTHRQRRRGRDKDNSGSSSSSSHKRHGRSSDSHSNRGTSGKTSSGNHRGSGRSGGDESEGKGSGGGGTGGKHAAGGNGKGGGEGGGGGKGDADAATKKGGNDDADDLVVTPPSGATDAGGDAADAPPTPAQTTPPAPIVPTTTTPATPTVPPTTTGDTRTAPAGGGGGGDGGGGGG